MSTRLAKDSARDVVTSEQASAITANNFTTMCFTVVRLQFTCSMSGNLNKSRPIIFYQGEAEKL
jgi:hypothetical protein